jgi:hypothetical protein
MSLLPPEEMEDMITVYEDKSTDGDDIIREDRHNIAKILQEIESDPKYANDIDGLRDAITAFIVELEKK